MSPLHLNKQASSKNPSNLPHVVILGGGFAGLAAGKALAKYPVKITLIDKENHHLFQPLLYQVATAGLSAADIAQPLRHIFFINLFEGYLKSDSGATPTAVRPALPRMHAKIQRGGTHIGYGSTKKAR